MKPILAILFCLLAGCTGRQNPGHYDEPSGKPWAGTIPETRNLKPENELPPYPWEAVTVQRAAVVGTVAPAAVASAPVIQPFTLAWNVWPTPPERPTNHCPAQCVVLASPDLVQPFQPVAVVPCYGRWGDYAITVNVTNQPATFWCVRTE